MNALHAMLTIILFTIIALGQTGSGFADDQTAGGRADIKRLLDGVQEVAAPGVPGNLVVFGESAFVVVAGRDRDLVLPVIAAARWEKGRVVAFGHDGYFAAEALETADTGQLMVNAIAWCGGGPVGVHARERMLHDFLRSRGIPAEQFTTEGLPVAIKRFRLLCFRPSAVGEQAIPQLEAFVRRGGGLIVAETGWGWLQLNPGKTLPESVGNRLLFKAGIVWGDRYVGRTSPQGFRAGGDIPSTCHLRDAWQVLVDELGRPEADPFPSVPATSARRDDSPPKLAEKVQASATLQAACRVMPRENRTFWDALQKLADPAHQPVPTLQRPITREMARERLQLVLFGETWQRLPPEKVPAHPAANDFPGGVPATIPRRSKSVVIDPSREGWQSTGYYAPPGEVITLEFAGNVAVEHFAVRIGSHSDTLWDHDAWRRVPEIVCRFPLRQNRAQVASPFGGLVYIEAVRRRVGPPVRVVLSGGVEAPHFVAGKTSPAEWERLRKLPVPWGELESSKIVLTLPGPVLRGVDDPEEVLAFWDRVMDACADLAGLPRGRERPERIVTDRQISAGYMHAGYPIMTHLDVAELIVRPNQKHTDPRWGLFHELGHNHQSPAWTFPEVSEVTCNLFTIYVLETVCGMEDRAAMHPELARRRQKMTEYFAKLPSLERLGRDPFLGLIPYLQLQEEFGWEAYKRVFADYVARPPEPFPRSTQEKIDQWVLRFSRSVGRNLVPFHRRWGFPVSPEVEAALAGLPVWMPRDLPVGGSGSGDRAGN